ncbi:LysE family transporter [Alicyclobacillus vulcanalis]|uniref:Chemosensory pili system protein ChpE/L-lysine exporter family protein LysE/ArgO n=1 Tax=Alicyclobacillus vulcanalis TaxID=252246 RepID=A0A1N7P0M5_9BACL|nr:LysE family transporter [Alicyclobacillus vulcanalis]SIT04111.1 chemosensory pili system protein ChpE/L-lysine exporter family protein LysE/ArgO [Alicyclobacillus vulcanalis]
MIALLITACVLGFVYSAAPGAVNTEALRRGLQRGFAATFLVQLGALLGDLMWAIIGLTGVALVFHFVPVQIILGIAGVTFLLRMAWLSFLDARKSIDLKLDSSKKEQRDFITGIIFSLANPFGIAFWGGIGGGFATHIASMPLIDKLLFLFLGFSVGAFAWCIGISVLVAWSRKFIGEKLLRGIFTVSSLAMAYFALEMLWTLIHTTLYPLFSHRLRVKASH